MHKNVNCILPLLTVWGSQAPPYCKLGMRARTARHTQTQTPYESHCANKLWCSGLLRPHFLGWVLYHCPASPRRLCQIIALPPPLFKKEWVYSLGTEFKGRSAEPRETGSCQDLGSWSWKWPCRSHAWFGCACARLTKSPRLPRQMGADGSRSGTWTVLAILTSKSNLFLIILS